MIIKPIRNSKDGFNRATAVKKAWSEESFLSLLLSCYACELLEKIERNTRHRKVKK
jgi:hypothetical protein